MNKIITANFDSIDMATLALKNIKESGIPLASVKINYKKTFHNETNDISSNVLLPNNTTTNFNYQMFGNETVMNFIPLNIPQSQHPNISDVKVIIKALDNDINTITSTLRNYGGLSVKEN
ncbi:MAG: hypothetical protein RSE07_05055 [Oscillospiraceae bacterium]